VGVGGGGGGGVGGVGVEVWIVYLDDRSDGETASSVKGRV